MKRSFRFRLARVARVREVFEEHARGELSAAMTHLHETQARLDDLRRALDEGRRSLADAQAAGRLEVTAILAHEQALETLGRAIAAARAAVAQAELAAEECQAIWRERRSERQALHELRTRHEQRHLEALNREESRESDEVAIGRFSHSET